MPVDRIEQIKEREQKATKYTDLLSSCCRKDYFFTRFEDGGLWFRCKNCQKKCDPQTFPITK